MPLLSKRPKRLNNAQVWYAVTVRQIAPIGSNIPDFWTDPGLATLGIFGPAFLMIASSGYLLPRMELRAEVPHGLPRGNCFLLAMAD